jgi:phosphinothricin acetyltransferase
VVDGVNASKPLVRFATAADAAAIARIHNQGIEDRIATFQIEPRTAESVARQLAAKGDRYPTIVVVAGGEVVAYAGAGPYREGDRPWYAGIAEHSVYVDRAARGRGYGRFALAALCDAYEERGFWKLLSRIFPKNTASLALHQACGFRVVGVYERHGRLDGVWHDCVIVERLLGEAAAERNADHPTI